VVDAGNVVFTPDPGAFSAGTFSYTVSDGALTSSPALVTIAAVGGDTITGGSDPAVLLGDDVALTLSTIGNAKLGGLTFGDDDLVEYDPAADNSTLAFDGGALFNATNEDIDAVHVLSNGHIVLSTVANATLGGLTFGDDDLVEYDPVSDTASLLFDGGALFSNTREDINAAGLNGSDVLAGGAGNDWLNGGVGSDSLDAGAGEDTLVWNAADRMIDGGGGIDTLRVASGNVDLPTFAGAIAGIERIDLTSDAGANAVTLTAQDVLDISDTDIVTLLGDSTDSIAAGTGWTDGGVDSSGHHIYSQMVGPSLATLLVDPDMLVNPDILT
jgi:Ca2+-binding RTX toxin-like protein